ncbi:hypothetical protein A4G19_01850 [Pasteurellaceae bacterium Macca]|nr:hypothetical protein [Pasteurellaceae bacterium Macca]
MTRTKWVVSIIIAFFAIGFIEQNTINEKKEKEELLEIPILATANDVAQYKKQLKKMTDNEIFSVLGEYLRQQCHLLYKEPGMGCHCLRYDDYVRQYFTVNDAKQLLLPRPYWNADAQSTLPMRLDFLFKDIRTCSRFNISGE